MTFDLPGLQAGEVLIRVTHSGLCGSELYMLDRPLVLGHEGECSERSSPLLFSILSKSVPQELGSLRQLAQHAPA